MQIYDPGLLRTEEVPYRSKEVVLVDMWANNRRAQSTQDSMSGYRPLQNLMDGDRCPTCGERRFVPQL